MTTYIIVHFDPAKTPAIPPTRPFTGRIIAAPRPDVATIQFIDDDGEPGGLHIDLPLNDPRIAHLETFATRDAFLKAVRRPAAMTNGHASNKH
jgi:hypothetical protein